MNLTIFAAEEANHIFLPGDINEFWWGFGAFSIVMIFLAWKVRPGIARMFKASIQKTEEELFEAEAAVQSAESDLNNLKSKLGDIGAERERILADARRSAEELEADLRSRAEEEAAELRRRAKTDLELSKIQAESDLKTLVADRAFKVAEATILESLTPQAQSKLVTDYIDKNLKASNQ